MHGCARGPPPEGRWGGRSNPPLNIPIKECCDWGNILGTTMLQITSFVCDPRASYVSHKRSYLEHCSSQNITPVNCNTL